MVSQMHYKIVGVMSGTSLDGLDLVLVDFQKLNHKWKFSIQKAETVAYPETIVQNLKHAVDFSQPQIQELDISLGQFIGTTIKIFIGNSSVDFIASHGHTIFHQPENRYTLQIGSGEKISEESGLPVINNFRAKDVSLGGQGAPLVPIGDRDLFSEYTYCLNLGGIANISFERDNARIAFDICPFNMALNELANQSELAYDDKGVMASGGIVDHQLLEALSKIPYLSSTGPKSLGLEDYQKYWQPLITSSTLSLKDKMCTFTEHAALEIGKQLAGTQADKTLVTGGGTFHDYFISRLKLHSDTTIFIPDRQTIEFKEALIFAYLGLLRYLDEPNCLSSVTGASEDSSGGDLYNF
ncbi:anhydro-N-acetylmuramic acid kinase [Roseivirga sp. 4D4]|uniref:anhydro-N-acetylmuramic acid kinase n=1 Tax=Roseivirga sp. 4D4 TaxID=1889784 RepID=UPI0008534F7D|nr:anhydro-N-acetylmuramic acid kinase [Roseivirga sp. 4D4]OEK02837.1 anhydro-N-acetylmuramic acid kinase [Roseivirga sp. 4D4]